MPREKKDSRNFACKFDREIFEKLEEYCKLTGQNKTIVVGGAGGGLVVFCLRQECLPILGL